MVAVTYAVLVVAGSILARQDMPSITVRVLLVVVGVLSFVPLLIAQWAINCHQYRATAAPAGQPMGMGEKLVIIVGVGLFVLAIPGGFVSL